MPSLYEPLQLGALTLPNRVIMAPLTRMRSAQPGNIPTALNAQYYAQRASAGLIISEATQVSASGQGYPATPGIHSPEQVEGWKLVTKAVHDAGGRIFAQLWHVGRISHTSLQPNGALPVAPSAIAPSGLTFTAQFQQVPFETPHALTIDEIKTIVADFVTGAKNAQEAGFDGIEIHGANGYLLDQFLQDGSNTREDIYGGAIENRARLLLEVVDATVAVLGKDRVGVRLSPYGQFNDMHDSDPVALFTYVLQQISSRGIAYAHVIEPRSTSAGGNDNAVDDAPVTAEMFRASFDGVFLSAGGYLKDNAEAAVASGNADAVVFGRYFISNPDLPARLQRGLALTPYNRATFYGGAEVGYTDYPFADL
jgi:N-ethylmaleimide reductase